MCFCTFENVKKVDFVLLKMDFFWNFNSLCVGEDEDECCLAFNLSELMESPINEAGSLVVEVAAAYIAPA